MSNSRLVSLFCFTVLVSLSGFGFLAYRLILGEATVSPGRWCLATFAPFLVTAYGLLRRSLDATGALAAVYVGIVLTLAHLSFFLALLFFFFSSSKATKYKQEEKRRIEGKDFKEGGRRNWVQVFCNGGVATYLSLLYLLEVGSADLPLNFTVEYRGSCYASAVLGALACCNGDTWASELGSVVSKGNPRLITTWQVVPKGTNGGVSLMGLVVSLLGGMFVGLGFWLGVILMSPARMLAQSQPQWYLIFLGGFGGLFGSVMDSLLGAVFQYSGVDCNGAIVDTPKSSKTYISGMPLLDNHGVNLLSSAMAAAVTMKVAQQYFY